MDVALCKMRRSYMEQSKTKLFQKDFTLVVVGQIISLFGNAILRFALPVYLLKETGSAALFGAVSACSFIPMIILSLVGGVLADRVNKRNIMVALDFMTAIIILFFFISFHTIPTVPLFIVVLMLLYGITGTYQPTVQASIPVLVSKEYLMKGNAIINQVNTLSGLLGPVIGGMMFGSWGIIPILRLSIGCFTASAIMELFIHIPCSKRKGKKGVIAIVREDLQDSFRFVKEEKPIFFSILFIAASFNLVFSAAVMIGIPVMIVQTLQLSDELLGFTQGGMALGGLMGGLLSTVVSKKLNIKKGHRMLYVCSFAILCMAFSFFLQASAIITYLVISIMIFFSMGASTIFNIQLFTVVQQQTPSHLIGKVMAVIMSFSMCAQPIGQSLYGVIFQNYQKTIWMVLVVIAAISFAISYYSKRIFNKIA